MMKTNGRSRSHLRWQSVVYCFVSKRKQQNLIQTLAEENALGQAFRNSRHSWNEISVIEYANAKTAVRGKMREVALVALAALLIGIAAARLLAVYYFAEKCYPVSATLASTCGNKKGTATHAVADCISQ